MALAMVQKRREPMLAANPFTNVSLVKGQGMNGKIALETAVMLQ